MTTPIDFAGMPISYSAIFTAVEGTFNPELEPNHPWAHSNRLRVRVPKGVATVQVSTNYVGVYRLCHQEDINGIPINNYHEMNGGGMFQARSLGDLGSIFISTPEMKNSTDNWGLVVTSFPPGTV